MDTDVLQAKVNKGITLEQRKFKTMTHFNSIIVQWPTDM